jgi:hypothetical protein
MATREHEDASTPSTSPGRRKLEFFSEDNPALRWNVEADQRAEQGVAISPILCPLSIQILVTPETESAAAAAAASTGTTTTVGAAAPFGAEATPNGGGRTAPPPAATGVRPGVTTINRLPVRFQLGGDEDCVDVGGGDTIHPNRSSSANRDDDDAAAAADSSRTAPNSAIKTLCEVSASRDVKVLLNNEQIALLVAIAGELTSELDAITGGGSLIIAYGARA